MKAEFDDVRVQYVPEYDQLWIERGEYSAYSGDITFHGNRIVLVGQQLDDFQRWLNQSRP